MWKRIWDATAQGRGISKIFLAYVCSCERESPGRKAVACARSFSRMFVAASVSLHGARQWHQRPVQLRIQKLLAMLWFRQHARFIFPEHAIAIARYQLVDQVSKRAWQDSSPGCDSPNASEFSPKMKDRIRTLQYLLIPFIVVQNNVDSVEVTRVESMPL